MLFFITRQFSTASLLSILLLVAGCGGDANTSTTSLPLGKGPQPTIVISNTAPSNIDISFGVTIVQYYPNDPAKFSIGYTATYQGELITFQQGEKMQCNDLILSNNGSKIYIDPIPPAGTVYNCNYTSPQGKARFSFTAPGRLTITSPVSGAIIARSTSTPYTMTLLPDCQSTGIGIVSSDGRGGMSLSGSNASVNCGESGTMDTTKASLGIGGISVEEFLQPAYATNNPGFHSFVMQIFSSIAIPVTWQ